MCVSRPHLTERPTANLPNYSVAPDNAQKEWVIPFLRAHHWCLIRQSMTSTLCPADVGKFGKTTRAHTTTL